MRWAELELVGQLMLYSKDIWTSVLLRLKILVEVGSPKLAGRLMLGIRKLVSVRSEEI